MNPDLPHIIRTNKDEMTDEFIMHIPLCCQEGHDNCPHVVNRAPERKKRNKAL